MTGPIRRRRCAWILLAVALLVVAGCAGKKKTGGELLPADASFERATKLLNEHELRQALATLKRIQFEPSSREEIEPLTRLALADATYHQGSAIAWIDARNLYLDFVMLNGEHPLAPYAQLQVGQCSLNQVNHPSKDQTLTHQAIRDLEAVGRRWPGTPFVAAAIGMEVQARANLAESEYLIGRFYLKKKKYRGAVGRFIGIVRGFPEFPEMEKVLYHLALAYVRKGEEVEGRIYLENLLTRYPNGEYVKQAQKLLGSIASGFEGEVGGASE